MISVRTLSIIGTAIRKTDVPFGIIQLLTPDFSFLISHFSFIRVPLQP